MRLIDADALIKALNKRQAEPEYQHNEEDWYVGMCSAEELVWEQPVIEPERKKGTWIDMDDHLLCSCCGATHYGNDKNFCPNCGAQMEEVQNLVYADGDTAYGGLQSAT